MSAFCFTAMTVLIRRLAEYPPPVQAFFGNLAMLAVMAPTILRAPRKVLLVNRVGLTLGRSAASAGGVMLYYYAYSKMPLAEANALSFTRALWIAPLAAILIHERVGALRWAALIVGFGGVLLIANPGNLSAAGWVHIAALASAFLLALGATGMKMLTRDQGPTTILAWNAVLGVLFTALPAFAAWRSPDLPDLGLLIGLGLLSLGAQATYVRGMALGEASLMASVDYSRLVMALAIGLVLYGEIPTFVELAGTTVIVLSTLLVIVLDARRKRVPPPPTL